MRFIQFTQPSGRVAAPSVQFGGRFGTAGIETELDWLFGPTPTGAVRGQFPVDIYEDKDNTYVRAEMPGVTRDSISVEFADGTLSIQGSRKEKSGEGDKPVSLTRQVNIFDEVDSDKVAAAYENGVLTVTLPRKEEAKPKKINVSVN